MKIYYDLKEKEEKYCLEIGDSFLRFNSFSKLISKIKEIKRIN